MSGVKIQIEADYSRPSLERARAEIERLLESLPSADPVHEQAEADRQAGAKVDALWRRLGINTRTFLSTAAQFPEGTWFSFPEIAERAGKPLETIKSWHRNMSRSLKQVEAELGAEPPILEQRWNGERNEYSFPPAVRLAIRQQHPAKLPGDDTD